MSINRFNAEENIAKATAIIEPGFVTVKADIKRANDYLNNAYSRIRSQVMEATSYNSDLPFDLHQYRAAKHEGELDGNQEWIDTINRLVGLRAEVKATPVQKKESKAQREQRIAAASPIAKIAAEFDALKPGIKEDYINRVRKSFENVVGAFLGEWHQINKEMSGFVRVHTKTVEEYNYSRGAERMIDEVLLEKKAQAYADEQVGAFVHKLALKLVDLENPQLINVKPGAFEFEIIGTLNNKTVRVVQNIKYGWSKFNNPYVQWPALIYVDGGRVSEKEFHDNYVTTEA